MKYLVAKHLGKGQFLEVATFIRRWQAERYAEHESAMSGFSHLVEELSEDDTLRTLRPGKRVKNFGGLRCDTNR